MIKLGIIGGSGLENLKLFTQCEEIFCNTIYGEPSPSLFKGIMGNTEVVIISRHGRKHTITPTNVNNRANITALKEAGCTHIIGTTACGSLKEEIKPGDLVFLDQFIDFTRNRVLTFFDSFEPDNMKHTPMADPFSKELRTLLIDSAKELNLNYHSAGTVVTIEGPRFSTRAESKMFTYWGADVINMSTAPEAALANEAEIPYAAIALSTDYDCWKINEEPVTWEAVLKIFNQNVSNVTSLLAEVINKMNS